MKYEMNDVDGNGLFGVIENADNNMGNEGGMTGDGSNAQSNSSQEEMGNTIMNGGGTYNNMRGGISSKGGVSQAESSGMVFSPNSPQASSNSTSTIPTTPIALFEPP
jgi:hypothetical protein